MSRQVQLKPELIIVISAGFLLAYAIWYTPVILARDLFPRTMDFVSFYTAAQLVLQRPEALYDLQAQSALQRPIFYPFTTGGNVLGYFNTPLLAYLIVPLTVFTYETAFWLFVIINSTLFCATTYILNRLHHGTRLHHLAWILGGIAFFPVFKGIILGQNSILSLFVLTGTIHFLLHQRERLASRILAIQVFKPQFALLFVVISLYKRRRDFVGIFLFTAGTILAISFLPLGIHGITEYIIISNQIVDWDKQNGIFIEGMQSWRGLFYLLLPHEPITAINYFSYLAGILTLLTCIIGFTGEWNTEYTRFKVQCSLVIFCTLLATPHIYNHDLTLLLLPAALLLAHTHSGKASNIFVRLSPIIGSLFFLLSFLVDILSNIIILPLIQFLLLFSVLLCFFETRWLRHLSKGQSQVPQEYETQRNTFYHVHTINKTE